MKLSGYSVHLRITNRNDLVTFRAVFLLPSLKTFLKFLRRTIFSRKFWDGIVRALKNDVPNPAAANNKRLQLMEYTTILEKRICQYGIVGKPAEVANYYTLGIDKKEIAEIMHITENTVVQHLSDVRILLGLKKNEDIPAFLKK